MSSCFTSKDQYPSSLSRSSISDRNYNYECFNIIETNDSDVLATKKRTTTTTTTDKTKTKTTTKTTSDGETIISLLKGNIGPGCLALPWAFTILGIPLGCLITILISLLVGWNAWTLVVLKRKIWGLEERGVTYGDVGEQLMGSSFRIIVDASVISLQLSVCTVFLSNMGENFSSVLHRWISTNDDDDDSFQLLLSLLTSPRGVMVALLPFIMTITSLPNLKTLAPYISLATVLMFTSFLLIGVVIASHWSRGYSQYIAARSTQMHLFDDVDDWSLVPLATCAIMYSLEGDQLVLPIESAMTHRRHFKSVLIISMIVIGVVFCVFASLCVIAFGDVDDGSITAFLLDHREDLSDGEDDSSRTTVILLLTNVIVTLSLFFTYPLQLYPALGLMGQIVAKWRGKSSSSSSLDDDDLTVELTREVSEDDNSSDDSASLLLLTPPDNSRHLRSVETSISYGTLENGHHGGGSSKQKTTNNNTTTNAADDDDDLVLEGDSLTLRFSLVILTFIIAVIVPHLKVLIALAGSIAGSMTSLLIPPFLGLRYAVGDLLGSNDWSRLLAIRSKATSLQVFFRDLYQSSSLIGHHLWIIAFYLCLIVIGVIYAVLGTTSSIKDVIALYSTTTTTTN